MRTNVKEYVKKCDTCQRFGNLIHVLTGSLNLVTGPWPFAMWGIDIVGPLPSAQTHKEFMLIAIHYFLKWIQAKVHAQIKPPPHQVRVAKHCMIMFVSIENVGFYDYFCFLDQCLKFFFFLENS